MSSPSASRPCRRDDGDGDVVRRDPSATRGRRCGSSGARRCPRAVRCCPRWRRPRWSAPATAGTAGDVSPEWTAIRQPRCPGGAALNARSPLTATSATRHAQSAEHLDGLAGGVALADARRRPAPCRPCRTSPSDASASRWSLRKPLRLAASRNAAGSGRRRGLPSLAPQPDDGPLRDVERAAGRRSQVLRRREDREQILADPHRRDRRWPW